MPILIPKREQQETFFRERLEPGESIQAVFWCEQRLPLLLHWLIDQTPIGSLIFSALRHRYFMALTDRRLLIMGSIIFLPRGLTDYVRPQPAELAGAASSAILGITLPSGTQYTDLPRGVTDYLRAHP